MKILVVNTTYRTFGGEDSNIKDEIDFLKKNHEVYYLEYKNSESVSIFEVLSFFFNTNYKSNTKLKKTINKYNPDLIYIHNTWFKAHLGVFNILKRSNKKVLLKLHNFRYDCTRSYLVKNHLNGLEMCFRCGLRKKRFSLLNLYFPGNLIKSFFINRYGVKYFKIFYEDFINLVVLTKFHQQHLIDLGIESRKIKVFPNYIDQNKYKSNYQCSSNYIVYAGRIDENKGVEELVKSWLNSKTQFELRIIGDGPQLQNLKNKFNSPQIKFYGALEHFETLEIIKGAKCVITATKMYEGQPRLLSEASFFGVPSIFPKFGGMHEFFPNDYPLAFEQFNYSDLIKKIKLIEDEDSLQEMSNKLLKFVENEYSEESQKFNFDNIL